MVELPRSLWKRQNKLSRAKSSMPAYDVMQEESFDERDVAQPVTLQPQGPKQIVHAPSDPGMLSYISQPAESDPMSPKASGWAGLTSNSGRGCANGYESASRQRRSLDQTSANSAVKPRHRRTGTWSHISAVPQGTVRHERSGSGAVIIGGPASSDSPRQFCGYQLHVGPVTQPALDQTSAAKASQQQHQEANLISWDEPEHHPANSAAAIPLQQQHTFDGPVHQQKQQGTQQQSQCAADAQQQLLALQLSKALHQQAASHSLQATSCQALSGGSSASSSLEALTLVPKNELFGNSGAASSLPERLPAFTQARGPIVPEQSFEQSAVW